MTDIVIRNLSDEAVVRIDAAARQQGLSRNEFLRRHWAKTFRQPQYPQVNEVDWHRFSLEFGDLSDPEVMAWAWN